MAFVPPYPVIRDSTLGESGSTELCLLCLWIAMIKCAKNLPDRESMA
jgi:hypothetical protein